MADEEEPVALKNLGKIFAEAAFSLRNGDFDRTEFLCLKILKYFPRHTESINLLGLIRHQSGKQDEAALMMLDAISINPVIAEYHANLGIFRLMQKEWDEAKISLRNVMILSPELSATYDRLAIAHDKSNKKSDAVKFWNNAVKIDCDNAEFHLKLGYGLYRLGRMQDAITRICNAIIVCPDLMAAYSCLAEAMRNEGQINKSISCYNMALALEPNSPEICNDLGNALLSSGNFDEGKWAIHRSIVIKPEMPAAYFNLSLALQGYGQSEDAEKCALRYLFLVPNHPDAHNQLASILEECGKPKAMHSLLTALSLQPDSIVALCRLGDCLYEGGMSQKVLFYYRRSLVINPDYPDAHYHLGVVMQSEGRLTASEISCRKAIILQPDYPDAHVSLAKTLLANGKFEEGWKCYEWRWRTSEIARSRRNFMVPQWHGENGNGRSLLIHAEQGLGDSLQFCRFAPQAVLKGWRVILEVPPSLVRLMKKLEGISHVIGQGDLLPSIDSHCPMMSLPFAFGTNIENIPSHSAYLHADKVASESWKKRLDHAYSNAFRVGLVWASSRNIRSNRHQSIAPELLEPLFRCENMVFFSLQKDGPLPPPTFPIINFMEEIHDFYDTAAFIANLDLVISIDTSILHLAAAMGKTTWLLDRFSPCWRWLRSREDSPWYPALRIFRQTEQGDWAGVIERVRRVLRKF